jgi:KDO2-lipid IV(A) lauroyltransferase
VQSIGSDEERIAVTVQNIASAFEVGLAEHPEDWHMLQRIWIDEGIYA